MNQTHAYRVDLTKINGDGEFLCPRCGATISPDDEREEAYSILGSKANDNGLEEMVVRCNNCASHIHLTGFSLLHDLSETSEAPPNNQKEANVYYIDHV